MSVTVIGSDYFTDRIDSLQTLQVDLVPAPGSPGTFQLRLHEETRRRVCQQIPHEQDGDYDITEDGLRHLRRIIDAALGDRS